jgi:glutamate/tyrosine decarboxylase-like PLP-dependent enzyme
MSCGQDGQDGWYEYLHLHLCLEKLAYTPVIVIATSGTTVHEGHDPISQIGKLMKEHPGRSYLHVNAALCGFTTPILD